MDRNLTALLVGIVFVAGLSALDSTLKAQEPPPAAMTGTWAGTADIAVNWTAQRTLAVRLTILSDGRVSGTVGDATLRNGRFASNRGPLARALNWKTDWIVVGDLDGEVIKAEGIHRAGVNIPMNWNDDHFEGGVHTSGWHWGGKDKMWLAASRLRLRRMERG